MTITAKVIAHSRAAGAPDLITLQLRYPRFIHAEFMTHRVFSRNASSSRAIPVDRMIQDVIDDPAMPVAWGSNKPGMQAGEECTNEVGVPVFSIPKQDHSISMFSRRWAWLSAKQAAVEHAEGFAKAGYHKQIVNRLLEPFAHISVVVTATDWQNFFDLRCHPDADPTMRALAEAMRDAIAGSTAGSTIDPVADALGCHLPYVDTAAWDWAYEATRLSLDPDGMFKALAHVSAARCARVSYLNHDGSNPDIEKDLALAERLIESKHMSPFEHQAVAQPGEWSRNFNGWRQHRAMLENQ